MNPVLFKATSALWKHFGFFGDGMGQSRTKRRLFVGCVEQLGHIQIQARSKLIFIGQAGIPSKSLC